MTEIKELHLPDLVVALGLTSHESMALNAVVKAWTEEQIPQDNLEWDLREEAVKGESGLTYDTWDFLHDKLFSDWLHPIIQGSVRNDQLLLQASERELVTYLASESIMDRMRNELKVARNG